jgi:hypothetical protein
MAEATNCWNTYFAHLHPYRGLGYLFHRPGWPQGGCPLVGEYGEENHGEGLDFKVPIAERVIKVDREEIP